MADTSPDAAPIYQATDDKGRLILVSDPAAAPPDVRGKLVLAQPKGTLTVEETTQTPAVIGGVHLPSLAIGLAVGALVGGLIFTRRKRPLVRAAVLVGGVCVVALLYLGMVMRIAGLSEAPAAMPGDILDEARAARDAANAQTDAKQRALDALDR